MELTLVSTCRMLIIEGVASALTAILGFFFLPDTPATTRWLNEGERNLAQRRMERDRLIDAQEQKPKKKAHQNTEHDNQTRKNNTKQNFHNAGLSFINFLPT